MNNTKKYLEGLFFEFERMGYSGNQVVEALYDYYNNELKT